MQAGTKLPVDRVKVHALLFVSAVSEFVHSRMLVTGVTGYVLRQLKSYFS